MGRSYAPHHTTYSGWYGKCNVADEAIKVSVRIRSQGGALDQFKTGSFNAAKAFFHDANDAQSIAEIMNNIATEVFDRPATYPNLATALSLLTPPGCR